MLLFEFEDFGTVDSVGALIIFAKRGIRVRGAIPQRFLQDGLNGRGSGFFAEMGEVVFDVVEEFFIGAESIAHELYVGEQSGG